MAGVAFCHVLVGWDGSRCAVRALEIATRLTESNGGRVLALAVLAPHTRLEPGDEPHSAEAPDRQAIVERFERALTRIGPFDDGPPSLEIVENRRVAETLIDYARTHGCDLIVLGQHGQEGALHSKLGHVAGHVARSEACPILLVPTGSR